jgi:hypothetical protein
MGNLILPTQRKYMQWADYLYGISHSWTLPPKGLKFTLSAPDCPVKVRAWAGPGMGFERHPYVDEVEQVMDIAIMKEGQQKVL